MIGEEANIEHVVALGALLHDRATESIESGPNHEDQHETGTQKLAPFESLKIDTWVNRTSVISIGRDHAYCRAFYLPQTIKPITNLSVCGIVGRSKAIGVVVIQVYFKMLRLSSMSHFLF